jgi:cytochrome b561
MLRKSREPQSMPNEPLISRYTPTAIALHWLVAFGILGAFSLGLYMQDLPISPAKLKMYSYHKWAGVTIFLLVLVRLAWRATHPPPPAPETLPAWQRRVAQAAHHLLYALLVAIPVSGWLMSSAKGFQTVWFGVLPLPDLLAKDKALGELLALVHRSLNFSMAALVCLHVGAALKHHFFDRDPVLARMLPQYFKRPGS